MRRPRERRRAVAERSLREPQPGRWHHEPECQLAEQRQLGLFGASAQGVLVKTKGAFKALLYVVPDF